MLARSYDQFHSTRAGSGLRGHATMTRPWLRLLACALGMASFCLFAASGPELPAGDFVARVYYSQTSDLARLGNYDLHEYNNRAQRYVRASANRDVFLQLQREGWKVEVDPQATADLNAVSPLTFYGAYRTVDELYAELAATVSNYPAITALTNYGQSYNKLIGGDTHGGRAFAGYDLKAIRVTNRQIPGPKPAFILMADIHAREITTPEVAMRFLNWLVRGYGVDADATWLVDYHETWIMPTVNPDGHWMVELGSPTPYTQRKNGHRAGSTYWPPNGSYQYGVDCNRNHSFNWNQGGSSSNPLDLTYRGSAPASEPEVSTLQDFIRSLIPDQRGPADTDPAPDTTTGILISLHSYADEVLWPWGHTSTPAPNAAGLQAIGQKFAAYNHYTAMQSIGLYPTSGTSDDWAYGELGIPAYTFEMGSSFMPSYSAVDSNQWPTNKGALIYACKIARTPYQTVRGPDAHELAFAVGLGGVTLTALIDDRTNGNQVIQAAECTLDMPWWAGGTPIPMSPSDGRFASAAQPVQVDLPLALVGHGRHIAYVRGQDSGGNWGPPSAMFIDLRTVAPLLSASRLNARDVAISWESVTNLAYTVAARAGLSQAWSDTAFTNVPGTGSPMTYTNRDASANMFFRLKAVPR
jgi:hypothetical protein